jgi:polyribonucleotide nucleotidyltransferase
MFNETVKQIDFGGQTLKIKTGKLARQATGSVLVELGDTHVLCTVVAASEAKEGMSFFPLTVNYRELYSAAGKIPGGFFKREGKPSEKEVLNSRLIDRPIRPLFPEGFYNEVQVVCTLLSFDPENDPSIVAMIGASAALQISGVPFKGPIGCTKVGYIDNEFVLNPTSTQLSESQLDLTVAGTESSVMMVESEAHELSEDTMLAAVEFGHNSMQNVIQAISELDNEVGKAKWQFEPEDYSDLYNTIKSKYTDAIKALGIKDKLERKARLGEIEGEVIEALAEDPEAEGAAISKQLSKLESELLRSKVLNEQTRIDDRAKDEIRPIETEASNLPRSHGSSLFTRGETQAVVTATLGTSQDEQIVDSLEGEERQHFMLHYNFPPYSVGEAAPMKPPGRREVGHGKLAWRALNNVLPTKEKFPYSIRVVSEITESNGSSSMATVCGASLALMDAGVPIDGPVAGIAMGLIKEEDNYIVLSDIMGDEDHLGDMDFKVAGTKDGVTALQMDIKVEGIDNNIMTKALSQAKEGRMHILAKMNEALSESREGVSKYAPTMTNFKIDKEKIKDIIGPGGKMIKEICEKSGAKIDIGDDGMLNISAVDKDSQDHAISLIKGIVTEPEIGEIYDGEVVKVLDFGLFVNFLKNQDGFIHISEITGEKIEDIRKVISEGDKVKAKIIGYDRGKARMSMKRVDQATGEDISDQIPASSSSSKQTDSAAPNKKPRRDSQSSNPENNEPVKEKKYFN